ncbi:stage II sporulation protein P [Desulfotomaculum arcticum]|uniref:Stage II sporulation protein P n=1 Tax=Desulfotruncus arcticus DSM 17038 TaxID=1121424 RepID=A0A1I2MTM7_9FIRM|nr:stage II sporulation protein P [Desulfotruncus arcticus]SFF94832.1 stage II sporulation protein P [Desulfotomaculum arcticum] [Desulfotruncus arcticus DSM 17038]
MKKNRIKIALGAGLLAVGISLLAYYTLTRSINPAWSPGGLWNSVMESEHEDGVVYKIMDRDNQLLSMMSRQVVAGDELISSAGRRYKITEVKDYDARAEFTGLDRELLSYQDEFEHMTVPVAGQADWKSRPVAIYHTHSAESYVPTDGTESKPYHGGVFQVGDALAAELQKRGVKVINNKTPHEPRDKNAYYRSRRTASELMKNNPVAIIDVHRDGIPDPDYYNKKIAGEEVTQVRLVVGRQNPKMQSNMDFAKKMMAYANKVHPGIVKEIFIAHGNYNQDLMSTAMLIEVGTHTNSRIAAQKGAALFADALPGLLDIGGAAGGPPNATGNFGPAAKSSAGWKTLAWIIGISLLGSAAFLLVSSGSWKNARKRLSGYWGKEFAGFMGPFKKKMYTSKGDVETGYSEKANNAARENREKIKND